MVLGTGRGMATSADRPLGSCLTACRRSGVFTSILTGLGGGQGPAEAVRANSPRPLRRGSAASSAGVSPLRRVGPTFDL